MLHNEDLGILAITELTALQEEWPDMHDAALWVAGDVDWQAEGRVLRLV